MLIHQLKVSGFAVLVCCLFSWIPVKGQFSFLIGMDTTQSLANYDYVNSLRVDGNGNLWIGGRLEKTATSSGGGVSKYGSVVQMNAFGTILSSKRSGFRSINSMDITTNGNFIFGGEGSGFMCTSGLCKSDMLVAKATPSGTTLWARSFGNPNYNGSDGLKYVKEAFNGDVIVVGNIYQSNLNSHPFVARLNGSTGDTIWTRVLSFPTNQFGHSASEGQAGEIFVGSSGDLRLAKMSSTGTVNWVRGFAGYGVVQRLSARADGSVIAAGHYLAASGTYNICFFKVSSSGSLLWFKDYNTAIPNNYEFINDMLEGPDGSFYLAGRHYDNTNFTGIYPLLMKVDSTGNLLWAKDFPGMTGEVKALTMFNGNLLAGMDYGPGVQSNKPDVLLVSVSTSGVNDCFVDLPMVVGNPLINPSNSAAYQYLDYETTANTMTFTNQLFWRKPLCTAMSVGISETVPHESSFIVSHHQGTVEIKHASQEMFNYLLMDGLGRELLRGKETSGHLQISLSGKASQLYHLRVQTDHETRVYRFVH